MRPILDVFSKIWFVNIILAACVAFFGAKSIHVWSAGEQVKITQTASQKTKKWPLKKIERKKMPPEAAYAVVTNKDLFTPERMEFVKAEKAAPAVNQKSEPKPEPEPEPVQEYIRIAGKKIFLYGVVITEDYKIALVTNPKPKKPKRPSIWVTEGDILGDKEQVLVSKIQKEEIIFQKGKKAYQISLYDKNKSRGRVAAQTQTRPKVVTTNRTPAAKSSAAASKSKNKATISSIESKNKTAVSSKKAKKNNKSKTGDSNTVNTPFGNIKIRE